VNCVNFILGTYFGFKATLQCRSPSTLIAPSSGRRSEESLFRDMEESKDVDCPVRVTGVGITICNMLNSLCGSWSEERLSRTVRLSS